MNFTIKEVAQQLNVAEETVRRWIRDGKLVAEDMGGRLGYRIDEEAFKKFIQNRGTVATSIFTGASSLGFMAGLATLAAPVLFDVTKNLLSKDKKNYQEDKLALQTRIFEIRQEEIALKAKFEQQKIEYEAKINTLQIEKDKIQELLKEHFYK